MYLHKIGGKLEPRTAYIIGLIGALLVLAGDLLMGSVEGTQSYFYAGTAVSLPRIAVGGLVGAIGVPLEAIGYSGLYKLLKNKETKTAKAMKTGIFGYAVLGGAGVHLGCAIAMLIYRQISISDAALAYSVTNTYLCWIFIPLCVLFSVLAMIFVVSLIAAFLSGQLPYPKKSLISIYPVGVALSFLFMLIPGNSALENGLLTGMISWGHLWMFGILFYFDAHRTLNNR